MQKNNQRIIFIFPGDIILTEVIFDILKNNGLEESPTEAYNKSTHDKDSRLIIVRDATLIIAQKKIPEDKLVELLSKHLETSAKTAQKIISDIKEKLIPFAKIITTTKEQEELLQKLKTEDRNVFKPEIKENEPPMPYLKTAPIINVEKNAENMQKEGKNIITEEKSKLSKKTEENKEPPIKNTKPDTYREPIE